MTTDYSELRREIRTVLPDRRLGEQKGPHLERAMAAIRRTLDDYVREHPDYTVWDIKNVYYERIPEEFTPFIFRNAPFYYEASLNGGWYLPKIGRVVWEYTSRFAEGVIPEEDRKAYGNRAYQHYHACSGFMTDEIHHIPPLYNILTNGFRYYHDKAQAELANCGTAEERAFLACAIAGLEAVRRVQLRFAEKAEAILASEELTEQQTRFMKMIAESARRCPWEPPQTFYEALNTLWFTREILALVDGLAVFALGRIDAYLIDFYNRDRAEGRLTEAEAYDLICRFLTVADCHYDGNLSVDVYSDHELEIPLTLGGCDREGKVVFNDITRMVLKAHQELDIVYPKLHCRFDKDSPHDYLRTIAEQVCAGHCVFAMFNDGHNIPALTASGVPLEWARNYIGTGCWDGYVDSITDVDTGNYCNVARVLEAIIHHDAEADQAAGLQFHTLEDCPDFATLLEQFYSDLITMLKRLLRDYTLYGKVTPLAHPIPAYSICINGCIESHKDATAGGCEQKPRIITLAFTVNVVDSLCAIKSLCYDRRICTVHELFEAVRRNWEGAEELRSQVLQAPHWGDDSADSNGLMKFLYDSIYRDIADLRNHRGGPYLIAAWVYREFRYWGETMKALPDGRYAGEVLSQGLMPSDFRNKEAVTTTINAIASLDHEKIFASNCNMSFDKATLTPEILEAVLRTFAARGIHLIQPNCFSREDLLAAQKNPEKYRHIVIKICGFSARFVSLSPEWQAEVLQRHQYA